MLKGSIDLDDQREIEELDNNNMLTFLEEFPLQCEQAVEIGRLSCSHIIADLPRVKNLSILGMGGSGISGDIARIVFEPHLKIPVTVNKSYDLPAFVNDNSLVLAVSYSGETEETLSSARIALERGAQLVAITSGGALLDLAKKEGLPLIRIPEGLQPRLAVGYLSIPVLIYLSSLGFVYSIEDDIEELIEMLNTKSTEYKSKVPTEKNQAKQLAKQVYGKIPIIYGDSGISGLAALRWKCQFNENSKVPAFYNHLPEMNHNEIVGWEEMVNTSREFFLMTLRDSTENPQLSKRFVATKELISDRFSGFIELESQGRSRLAKLFSLIYLGDFISVYLALLNGIDPTPVDRIQVLKSRIAK